MAMTFPLHTNPIRSENLINYLAVYFELHTFKFIMKLELYEDIWDRVRSRFGGLETLGLDTMGLPASLAQPDQARQASQDSQLGWPG
jgi:hypothetical protein